MIRTNSYSTIATDWNFWAGIVLTLGTTGLAPAMMPGLLALHLFRNFKLNYDCLILAVIVGASVFYVTDWTAPIEWAITVILLGSLIHHVRIGSRFVIGSVIVICVQLVFVGWQLNHGIDRPFGFAGNASSLGMSGFSLFQVSPVIALFASVTLGLSGSRTYLLAVAIISSFALWRRDTLTVGLGLLAATVFLAVTFETNTERLKIWDGDPTLDRRVELLQPVKTSAGAGQSGPDRADPDKVSPTPLAELTLGEYLRNSPLGTGYRDYTHEMGRPRPHNQFVLIFWELGWLAIPFLLVVAVMFLQSDFPWRYRLAVIPPLLLTDEFFARPEGLYAIFMVVISARILFTDGRESVSIIDR